MSAVSIERLDEAMFAAMQAEWDALVAEAVHATPFQTWEWLHAWWRHYGNGRLALFAVRARGRLVGLAPLHVARYFGTPLRRLQFIGTGMTDYLDVIIARDAPPETLPALLAALAGTHREWEFADLQQTPEGSPLRAAAPPPDLRAAWIEQEPCPYLALPDSWETFTKGLGKRLRQNLGYYRRLLERDFTVEWLCLGAPGNGEAESGGVGEWESGRRRITESPSHPNPRRPDDPSYTHHPPPTTLNEGMDAFFRLHQARWRGRGLPGAFARERERRFHLDVARAMLARGWLRLHLLRLDGQIVSALYTFTFAGRGWYYLGGFEPSLSRYSLGTVLTGEAIRAAISEGCHEWDFMRGDEPYKYAWGASDRRNARWLWWTPSGVSALVPRLNAWERAAEHRIKAWARSRR